MAENLSDQEYMNLIKWPVPDLSPEEFETLLEEVRKALWRNLNQ